MPPAVDGNSHLSLDALETAVRAADPYAFLVPAWMHQKLIVAERGPAVNVFSPRVQAHMMVRERPDGDRAAGRASAGGRAASRFSAEMETMRWLADLAWTTFTARVGTTR
jgi:hypothetical protein